MTKPIGGRAVVVGAGLGGLTAAKALTSHFEQVTILDRDDLPQNPEPRPGTPQARHAHALLAGGLRALAELVPSFEVDIERAGAVRARLGLDVINERPGFDPFPQRDLGLETFCASRPLIELTVRRALEKVGNVKFRSHCRVTELQASDDGNRIAAVRFRNETGQEETLPAEAIVDASGRAKLTLALLESIGAPMPKIAEIGVDLAYATAVFEIPADAPSGWKGVVHFPDPRSTSRVGLILPMEDGRWIVSIGGNHGDAPPGDIEGFTAFAKSLRTDTIYNAIRSAKQVGDVARFGFPASIRRHFERLEVLPRGLIPIADSLCRFNPVFGQGMTVAIQEARVLARLLDSRRGLSDPLEGLEVAFFGEIQELLEAPWSAAESDFAYAKTRGERPPDINGRLQYGSALMRLAAEDPAVHRLVGEVNTLVRPSSALRDPTLRSRVSKLMAEG